MPILNRLRRRPADTASGGTSPAAQGGKLIPLTWGTGLSVTLTVAFYVLVLAVDAGLHAGRHLDAKAVAPAPPSNVAAPSLEDAALEAPRSTETPERSEQPEQPVNAANALLERAHACASQQQWDCVFDATVSVIALRGETPETVNLLALAMNEGREEPPPPRMAEAAPAPQKKPTVTHYARNGKIGVNDSMRRTRYTKRVRKHTFPQNGVRYTAMTRPTSDKDLVELYRH